MPASSNPNLPVDPAVDARAASPTAPRRRSRSCTRSTARRSCAERIETLMGRYPDRRSASIPALWAVQRALRLVHPGGDPPGRRGDAGDARLPGVGGELLRPPPHRAGRHPPDRASAPTSAAGCAAATAARRLQGRRRGRRRDFFVTGFECLGACDIAPMASIDERYFGPLEAAEAATAIEQLRAGGEVLPEKALAKRGRWPGERLMAHQLETRVLLEHAEDPALRTLDGYRRLRRLRDAGEAPTGRWSRTRSSRSSKTRACAAAAAPASRWAKRPPSCRAARWPSTSAATPTSPSPAPSRTAS